MSSKADFFLKKTLGDDFFESLQKVELWKPGTRTTIDHEEIRTALHIVPRTVMSLLIRELTPMSIGEAKEINIPCEKETILKVTKHERDVYTGTVDQENKVIVDFKYRSIPGIGLVIMSALELYNVDDLAQKDVAPAADITEQIQKLIDERLALHDLIGKVVDKKIEQRDAIQQLLLAKLNDFAKKASQINELDKIARTSAPMSDPYFRGMANGVAVAHATVNDVEPNFVEAEKEPGTGGLYKMSELKKAANKKGSPLGSFLDQRKSKSSLKKNEFSIQLAKGENVNCPDCGGNIFDGQVFSGCICVGDDMEKKVFLKKTEEGIQVRFSKGWDQENIEMLLEILRKKNG